MRIGIDARLLERKMTGIGRYLLNILENIPECDEQNNYYLFSYGNLPQYEKDKIQSVSTLKFIPQGIFQKMVSPFWLTFILPRFLNKYNINLYFSPNHFLPPQKVKAKSVIVVHDIFHKINKNYHPLYYRKYVDLFLPRAVKNSDSIITISESSKRDIIRFYRVNEEKIKVIYPAADKVFRPRDLSEGEKTKIRERYKLPNKFILYSGVIGERKNIRGIIKIADLIKEKTKIPIILFGGKEHRGDVYLKEIKKRENIQYKGLIEGDKIPYIYNLAEIFLFPSFYEGFGLPVLEAMQSGIPVIASNTSSIPEILGKDGITCDPTDYNCFAEEIVKLLEDREFYDKVVRRGIERAKNFNWGKTTKEIVEIFNNMK